MRPTLSALSLPLTALALSATACDLFSLQDVGSVYLKSEEISSEEGGRIEISRDESSLLAGTSIDIPPGALDADTRIGIAPAETDIDLDHATLAGPPIHFGPDGLRFEVPVRITIPGEGDRELRVHVREADGVTSIIAAADVERADNVGLVRFEVSGFTDFQAGEIDCETADGSCPCEASADCPAGASCVEGRCEVESCVDEDADGYLSDTCGGNDCDDSDATISPAGIEIVDGLDNDCDGQVDEGITTCEEPLIACDGTCVDPATNPEHCGACDAACAADEICGGGLCTADMVCLDNQDCPEGMVCVSGICQSAPCNTDNDCDDGDPCSMDSCGADGTCAHPPTADGMACDDGVACTSDDRCLAGSCQGDPSGCDCAPGDTRTCAGIDLGSCTPGIMRCVDGAWGPCEGAIDPAPEMCDGLDNDCDGDIDNDCTTCAQQGLVTCDGACVDVEVDPHHCGACLSACATGQICDGGLCVSATACGSNPGCSAGEICANGICVAAAECATDADCDDGDPATTDTCTMDGVCTHTAPLDDIDGDGVLNGSDNCPMVANGGQDDADDDGAGDACDCDPDDPSISPFAPDTCGDAIDNNCDGHIDEGC